MDKIIEKAFLSALWMAVFALAAEFWFGTAFNFDLLSAAHWRQLGVLQASGARISYLFYFSLVAGAALLLGGLYLIARPKLRKLAAHANQNPPAARVERIQYLQSLGPDANVRQPEHGRPIVSRPPRLNLADAPKPRNQESVAGLADSQISNLKSQILETPQYLINEISDVFQRAGFLVKKPPVIGGVRPELFAAGADEVLWIGLVCNESGSIAAKESGDAKWKSDSGAEFESPVRLLAGAAERLNSLFSETLDAELKITVRGFVLAYAGTIANAAANKAVWDAFGIAVVSNMDDLAELIGQNRRLPADEAEDFDAFSDYIDTVSDYFNSENRSS